MRLSRLALVLASAIPCAGLAQRFEPFPVGDGETIQYLASTADGIYLTRGSALPLQLFRFDTGLFESIPIGAPPGTAPHHALELCTASDGSLWGTTGTYLFRRGPGETAVTYPEPIPGTGSLPIGCRGNGEVWTSRNSRIYRYAADGRLIGEFTHPAIPNPRGRMWGCADGSLWTAEGNHVFRLSPENAVTDFPIPSRASYSFGDLACASDGGAWYTVYRCDGPCTGGWIVRVLGNGIQRVHDMPEPQRGLAAVEGPDGAGWFTCTGGLGRIADGGDLVVYPHTGPAFANDLVVGHDGSLWFGDLPGHALTRFVLPPSRQVIPAVVGTVGGSGVAYSSDLAVANQGSSAASVTLRYVPSRPASGVGEAVATEQLLPGRQLVLHDTLAWFRSKGFSIPETGNVGTLSVESEGAYPWHGVTAIARTTSPFGPGRSGVAYTALWPESAPSSIGSRLRLFGLRQTSYDRTNLALVNLSRDSDLRLAVTLVSGEGMGPRAYLPDVVLAPGKWTQLDSVLASAPEGSRFPQGWAEVESLGNDGTPFGAYAVVNDSLTNDGSYLAPAEPAPEVLLPALVDTGAFRSELVLANPCCDPATAELTFAPRDAPPRTARVPLALLEQRIIPDAAEALGLGAGVGPLLIRFTDDRGRPVAGVASVRVATPDGYGVFLPGIPLSTLGVSTVRVAGLRQGDGVRSNLALVNAETDATLTLKVTLVDGETGARKEPLTVTLPPLGFRQLDQVLTPFGIAQGWAEIERTATTSTTGSGRFVAYGVLNDGERPGEGTGDGSILPMATEK